MAQVEIKTYTPIQIQHFEDFKRIQRRKLRPQTSPEGQVLLHIGEVRYFNECLDAGLREEITAFSPRLTPKQRKKLDQIDQYLSTLEAK